VVPVDMTEEPEDWRAFATRWLDEQHIPGDLAMLVAGPSPRNPDAHHRLEFIRLQRR
jgi:pyruvate kinase